MHILKQVQSCNNSPYCFRWRLQELYKKLKEENNFKTRSDAIEVFDQVNYFYLKRYCWERDFFNPKTRQYVGKCDHLEKLLNRYKDDIILRKNLMALLNLFESSLKSKISKTFEKYHPILYAMDIYEDSTQQHIIKALHNEEYSAKKHFYQKYEGSEYGGKSFLIRLYGKEFIVLILEH
ncbi:MAG: Abi family protein [Treponemataceae bacterium]